ncbi:hypothetical protein EOL96_06060 [Candidatus Saccharibacteria bacterium]|nr:hypothetical protein [Candidatus Saccharibacteria bacterium]
MRKKLLVIVIGLLVAGVGFFGLESKSAQADGYPPNCGTSAVVKCGATSQSLLDARILPDAKALYTKLGISTNLSLAKNGVVYPDGTVKVDGKTVATGAMTFGRERRNASDTTISAGGKTFYKHSITGADILRPVDAFVFLDVNGKFTGAIIKMCGNPVVANPTAKPAATCDLLSVEKIERTRFKFTGQASTKDGAKITGYSIVVKRGSATVDMINITSTSTSFTKEVTYETPGDYSAELTVKTTVGDKTSAGCKTTFTVEPEPTAVCKVLTATITNRTNYRLETTAGAEDGATINGYRYEIKDTSDDSVVLSKTVDSTATTSYIEGELPAGNYAASVVVLTSLGERNGEQCATTFTIEEEPKDIKVCDLTTNTIIWVSESEADNENYTDDYSQCEKVKVCDPESGDIISVYKSEADKYEDEDSDACKPVTPPTELPETGLAGTLSSVAGIGSLTMASYYYAISRRI